MTDEEKLQKGLPLIRHATGWTAEELGNKIGVSKQTISNLENQKTKMTKTQYLALQMVISQKIATTPDDLTLAHIMQLIMGTEEEQIINYDAIPEAMAAVEKLTKENGTDSYIEKKCCRSVNAMDFGVCGAAAALNLNPVAAIGAAILGAIITPWLTKALGDDKGKTK